MIGQTISHYRILERLGEGGMGVVYKAEDTKLKRTVALKFLPREALSSDEAKARFMYEAQAAAALNHPNICTVHDLGEHDGRHFIVMEFLEGETLDRKLHAGAIPIDELLRLATQLADALDAAHSAGILHRDIKPGNIFVTTRGVAKILDFGLVKFTHQPVVGDIDDGVTVAAGQDLVLTTPGMAMGTIAYMSPEQALGRKLDVRTDIFSLGVVLYEMATGQRPFQGTTPAGVFDAILNRVPTPPIEMNPDVTLDLARAIGRALEKDRDQRHSTAAELRSDLKSLSSGSRVAVDPNSSTVDREPPSIAVLPFVNMSADPENEYFTDGMAEEIISALCKIQSLRVASRTSSFAFKGKREDIREIGRALNVAAILEGSVRKAGNRLRITVLLIKVDDGYHLWGERFDRDLKDVFAIQDEIAESIAGALRVVLSAREKNAIQKIPTRNMEAYDLYLRGLAYVRQLRDDNLRSAETIFRRAVEIDPDFALAWVGLAECCTWLHNWFTQSEGLRRTADDASRRALAIDPDLAEAHVARGLAASLRDDHSQAGEEFRTAARLDPRLFEAYYFHGRVCMNRGKLEDAARLFAKAANVRAEDYQAPSLLCSALRGLGRTEDSKGAARRTLDVIEKHLRLYPDDVRAVYLASAAWSTLGEREKALKCANRALEMDPDDSGVRYNVACAYANEGLVDEALSLLEKIVAAGWGNLEWVKNDPDLDPLRNEVRFRAIIDRLSSRRQDPDT